MDWNRVIEFCSKTGFLPEAHTDFILAIVGEELGFITIFILLLADFWLNHRDYLIKEINVVIFWKIFMLRCGDFILIQSGINIGALVGVAPLTGVPLPLISYGGSSFFASSAGMGLVLWAIRRDKESANKRRQQQKVFQKRKKKNYRIKSYVEGRNNGATRKTSTRCLVVYIETN